MKFFASGIENFSYTGCGTVRHAIQRVVVVSTSNAVTRKEGGKKVDEKISGARTVVLFN